MHFLTILLCVSFLAAIEARSMQTIPNITQVIQSYGYPVEVHQVNTQDGFILTLYRIPKSGGKPVLLQHGLTDSAAGWCLNSPSESLSYILHDAGYDVWLGNNRGNGYSMQNVKFNPSQPEFWAFSWDEMGLYDFPANINYVRQQTGFSKISYIGHSEGTIQAFAGLVKNPSIAQNLNVYIALAPVAHVGHITVSIMQELAKLDADEILELFGVHEFYLPGDIHKLLPDACKLYPPLCEFGSAYFYGADTYVNETRLDYYTDYEPFPTSVQNIVHWAQGVRSNTFQMYDYGTTGNMQHYNQPTPPQYDLSKFPTNLPTVLFTGGIDGLADPQDVQRLLNEISIKPQVFNRPDYGHLDPLLGDKAYEYTYPTILSLLKTYTDEE